MDAKQLIEEIVAREGVTRYRIAKDMKVEPSTVYQWQRGKKHPNGRHLLELLRRAGRLAAMVILGVTIGGISAPNDALASTAKPLITQSKLCVLC